MIMISRKLLVGTKDGGKFMDSVMHLDDLLIPGVKTHSIYFLPAQFSKTGFLKDRSNAIKSYLVLKVFRIYHFL